MRPQAQLRRCLGRRVAWDIEHAGNSHSAVGHRHGEMADFVHEPGFQHGAIKSAAALQHQLAQFKSAPQFLQRQFQVNFGFAAEQIGHTGDLKMGEVIIAHAIRHEQNDMITTDLVFLKAQDTFGIRANAEALGAL